MLDRDGWFANCENECGAASCDQLKPDDFKDADTCLRNEFHKVGCVFPSPLYRRLTNLESTLIFLLDRCGILHKNHEW